MSKLSGSKAWTYCHGRNFAPFILIFCFGDAEVFYTFAFAIQKRIALQKNIRRDG